MLRARQQAYYRVVAQGDPVKLSRTSGRRCSSRSTKSIPVKKGNVVALTVPTWAPALAVNQPGDDLVARLARQGHVQRLRPQSAQTKTNNITRFYCLYRTARLAYWATIVSRPVPTSKLPGA